MVMDHPRSRGVYRLPKTDLPRLAGSSPLARGLRTSRRGVACGCGIIPARAGFTPEMYADAMGLRDHPRSRGVYLITDDLLGEREGSSPLARGLPRPAPPYSYSLGIIPARAGFTASPLARG